MITTVVLLGLLSTLTAPPTIGLNPPIVDPLAHVPADGSRVIVIGDSITQAGDYVVFVEAFLMTRFPERTITIINRGLSSETAAGTSEPDHPFPRPWIHDRFERDVTAWNPDLVVACYGMNDGIYHPFDPERFRQYQDGILRLIDRTRSEARARIDLLTPPPYDPYRRQVSDPEATQFGYRFPVVSYDTVLARYADWLRSITGEDLIVADANSSLTRHVEARRADRVSFSIMPDGIHPDPTGHWLIAQTLLLAWGVPGVVAEVHVETKPLRTDSDQVEHLSRNDDGTISFSWRSPLPMPLDPRCDPASITLEAVSDRLNRYRLKVSGLEEKRYQLLAAEAGTGDLEPIGTFSAEALNEGIDLTRLATFPTVAAAQELLRELAAHRSAQAQAWREAIKEGQPPLIPPPGEDDDVMQPLRARCQPRDLLIRIEPVAGQAP